ncbi:MAG: serine/threonine protein kinase [Deltaproteobacteria bacterium]|nr:serine/threonine protein kinase [Deltaproteobacteria bacterium]
MIDRAVHERRRSAQRQREVTKLDPALEPGTIVEGRYRIARRLGSGGMSTVVEAEVIEAVPFATGGRVALKVLHRALSASQESIARLLREADVVRTLAHENVCAVYDMGRTANGQPYLVMEFLEGENLAERIERAGRLDIVEVVTVLTPVLAALEAAHERGVIHRDLKPENIFIVDAARGAATRTKLLDFGVARNFGHDREQQRLTDTGMVMGTPYYMAPEQARGEGKLDQRVDVWALGVILYEALTGERPFHAGNYNALLVKILTQQPREILQVVPELPPLIALVVEKALAKRPEERFQTVRELGAALELAARELAVPWDDLDDPTVALPDRSAVALGVALGSSLGAFGNHDARRSEPTSTKAAQRSEMTDAGDTEILRRR